MNLVDAFAAYLVSLGIGTLGQDIFIGGAPSSDVANDNIWWIVSNGGGPIKKNSTGESMKQYQVEIHARNRDYKTILDNLYQLEERVNCDSCTQLDGIDTIDMIATVFPVDNDLDSEDRKTGMLQVNLTTYKECQ